MNTLKQLYASFLLVLAINLEALQRKLAGGYGRRLADQLEIAGRELRRATTSNSFLSLTNRELRQALAGVNKRGTDNALILGRTQFGSITRDTATTFDTVAFPTLGLTATVRGDDLIVGDMNPNEPAHVIISGPEINSGERGDITIHTFG